MRASRPAETKAPTKGNSSAAVRMKRLFDLLKKDCSRNCNGFSTDLDLSAKPSSAASKLCANPITLNWCTQGDYSPK